MEASTRSNRIHPLMAAASVSVILVSAVGIAAMTGLLPDSHSNATPATLASVPPSPDVALPLNTQAASAAKKESATTATDKETVTRASEPATVEKVAAPRTPTPAQRRTPTYAASSRVAPKAPPVCYDCGRVEAVNAIQSQAAPTGVGMVAGGVLGGLIGNQIGGGNGRKVAMVA